MIDRQFNQITFECDACDATLETGEEEWGDAKADFDRAGWRAEKVGKDWTHLCPKCRGQS
jgi:hypothetical protein